MSKLEIGLAALSAALSIALICYQLYAWQLKKRLCEKDAQLNSATAAVTLLQRQITDVQKSLGDYKQRYWAVRQQMFDQKFSHQVPSLTKVNVMKAMPASVWETKSKEPKTRGRAIPVPTLAIVEFDSKSGQWRIT